MLILHIGQASETAATRLVTARAKVVPCEARAISRQTADATTRTRYP